MKRTLFLTAWASVILVPFLHLQRLHHPVLEFLRWIFRSEATHAVAHFTLFSVFAGVLAWVLADKGLPKGRVMVLVFATGLGMGVLQEAFQALARGWFPVLDSCMDVGVDLLGTWVGWRYGRMVRGWINPNLI